MTTQVEMMKAQGYVPVKEAAEQAGVSVWSVYRWIEQGKIKGTITAGTKYVLLDSFARYMGPVACEAAGLEYPEDEDPNGEVEAG